MSSFTEMNIVFSAAAEIRRGKKEAEQTTA